MNWIDVRESLPTVPTDGTAGDDVLVSYLNETTRHRWALVVGLRTMLQECRANHPTPGLNPFVTHWMPLPEKPPAAGWISAVDAFPRTPCRDASKRVLVLVEDQGDGRQFIVTDQFHDIPNDWLGDWWKRNCVVTHWMPLPALPSETSDLNVGDRTLGAACG